ncbi:hypothetical protein IQ06DRAFT_58262 [Phaeosphaeriaceae sp. SRC1lsM3a]|nr:hypothetical protein IQ06DRAFT_58262 [Stagonospora sp. SRC1lsM3a]
MASHSRPPTKPSFLTLAREIRDQIYHHLFANTVYHILCCEYVVNISYGDASLHQHTYPSWLLLSKSILSDGLTQFAQHATCTSINVFSQDDCTAAGCTYLILRDAILLPSVRTVFLDLSSNCQYQANHPLKFSDDDDAFFCLMPRNNAMDRHGRGYGHHLYLIPFEISTRNYLPALECISLKIHVETFGWDASPSGIMLSAMAALKTLGVGHKSVHVEVTPPALHSIDGQVPSVAVIAAAWPRLQLLLQYVAWMLTREYISGADVQAKQKEDEKYQRRETWMPVEKASVGEQEAAQLRFEELVDTDRKRLVREWVNKETGSWHSEVSQGSEMWQEVPMSLARGLVAFMAPKLDPASFTYIKETRDNVFIKDEVASRGVVSYSCASTGEVYWIEDEVNGITGYMRDSEEQQSHRATHSSGFLALRKI